MLRLQRDEREGCPTKNQGAGRILIVIAAATLIANLTECGCKVVLVL